MSYYSYNTNNKDHMRLVTKDHITQITKVIHIILIREY